MAEQNGVSLRVQTPMQPIGVSGLQAVGSGARGVLTGTQRPAGR